MTLLGAFRQSRLVNTRILVWVVVRTQVVPRSMAIIECSKDVESTQWLLNSIIGSRRGALHVEKVIVAA